MFKVFTVEGWYEVPDELAAANIDEGTILCVRAYFIVAVLVGGYLAFLLPTPYLSMR